MVTSLLASYGTLNRVVCNGLAWIGGTSAEKIPKNGQKHSFFFSKKKIVFIAGYKNHGIVTLIPPRGNIPEKKLSKGTRTDLCPDNDHFSFSDVRIFSASPPPCPTLPRWKGHQGHGFPSAHSWRDDGPSIMVALSRRDHVVALDQVENQPFHAGMWWRPGQLTSSEHRAHTDLGP